MEEVHPLSNAYRVWWAFEAKSGQAFDYVGQEIEATSTRAGAHTYEDESGERPDPDEDVPKEEHHERLTHYYKWAAVWIGVMLTGLATFLYFQAHATVTYRTGYSETKVIQLPDQSEVTLNANSTLRYSRDWSAHEPREVWLRGEAFFHIRQRPDLATASFTLPANLFVVHTHLLDVETQGTQLNVHNRRGKVKVVLSKGQAKISVKRGTEQPIAMKQGDMVEASAQVKKLQHRQVNPALYSLWRNHKLMFEEVPMREVAHTIEDHFGVQVHFQDIVIAERKFTGAVPCNNLKMTLNTLSKTTGLRISQQPNQVVLIPRS